MKGFSKVVLAGALFSVLAVSCVSTNRGYQSSPVISRNVELDPIRADIEVDESKKLKGESSAVYVLGFRVSGDRSFAEGIRYSTDVGTGSFWAALNPMAVVKAVRLNRVRGAAAYNAMKDTDFDLLVHPSYTVTARNFLLGKKYTVSVDGYGGKYKNFRTQPQKVIIRNNGSSITIPDEK